MLRNTIQSCRQAILPRLGRGGDFHPSTIIAGMASAMAAVFAIAAVIENALGLS